MVKSFVELLLDYYSGLLNFNHGDSDKEEFVLDELQYTIKWNKKDDDTNRSVEIWYETLRLMKILFKNSEVVGISMEIKGNKENYGSHDISRSGKLLEGVKEETNGSTFMTGKFYNKDMMIEHKGIMVNGKREGFGVEYFTDLQRPHFVGFFRNDRWHGMGIVYSRNGKYEFLSIRQGEPVLRILELNGESGLERIEKNVRKLVVHATNSVNTLNVGRLLGNAPFLTELVIHDGSWKNLTKLDIIGFKHLKKIEIGDEVMVDVVGKDDNYASPCVNTLTIRSLPSLETLRIGKKSCNYIQKFEVEDCNELESISIGGKCNGNEFSTETFAWCREFRIMSRHCANVNKI